MTSKTTSVLFACAALTSSILALPSRAQIPLGAGAREIVVEVSGLRNGRGHVVGALYTSPAGWLIEGQSAEDCHASVRGGVARCVFHVVSAGPVAFAGFHDEDDDRIFDRDFLGLPQEGYAFSNDVRDPFGPPSFVDASFTPPRGAAFVVHARYGI